MESLKNNIRVVDLLPVQVVSGDSYGAPVDSKGLVAASGSITIATNPSNNHTVGVGPKTYTFKSTLSTSPGVDGEVKIGAAASDTLTNLRNAINLDAGTPDTDYPAETVRHPSVTAGTIVGTVLPITARAVGAAGNEIALVDGMSGSGNVVSGNYLTGGRDGDQFDGGLVRVSVGNITGTPDTVAVSVQECDLVDFSSGATEVPGGEAFEVAADTSYTLELKRTKKFYRIYVNFTGGTNPTVELAAVAVLHNWATPAPILV